jgi:hypothetical protein
VEHESMRTSTASMAFADAGRPMRLAALAALLGLMTVAVPDSASAQGRGRGGDERGRAAQGIPPGHLPPPGECRVWYDNRPPGQQPPPTSCANARATVARGSGRVVYGDAVRRNDDRRSDDRRSDDRAVDRTRDRYPDGTYPRTDTPADTRSYPRTLPDMAWAAAFTRGQRVSETRAWVGENARMSGFTDANRNGVPETVTWKDADGRIVQRWLDDNRDGRADRVELYQDDRVVRTIQ